MVRTRTKSPEEVDKGKEHPTAVAMAIAVTMDPEADAAPNVLWSVSYTTIQQTKS